MTAPSNGPARPAAIVLSGWRAFEKGALRGFFSVELPSGMVLHDCSLMQKDGKRWIGMPSQRFVKADGTVTYTPMVDFTDRATADKFRDLVLVAFDEMGGDR